MMINEETGLRVVEEARKWIGTPFRHAAFKMGVGVDCANLLIQVFAGTGTIQAFRLPFYPPDWFLHSTRERILELLEAYALPILDNEVRPGDVLTYQFGKAVAHTAIYAGDGYMIHAMSGLGVMCDPMNVASLQGRYRGAYRVKQDGR